MRCLVSKGSYKLLGSYSISVYWTSFSRTTSLFLKLFSEHGSLYELFSPILLSQSKQKYLIHILEFIVNNFIRITIVEYNSKIKPYISCQFVFFPSKMTIDSFITLAISLFIYMYSWIRLYFYVATTPWERLMNPLLFYPPFWHFQKIIKCMEADL